MNLNIYLFIILLILIFSLNTEKEDYFFTNYTPLKAFSSIKNIIINNECFFPEKTLISNKTYEKKYFDEFLYFDEIIEILGLNLLKNFKENGVFLFNQNKLFEKLNVLINDELAFSISYYYKKYYNVENVYNFKNKEINNILTKEGIKFYNNDNNKEDNNFYLNCGDTLLKKYERGIGILLSFKIIFVVKEQKINFIKALNAENDIQIDKIIETLIKVSNNSNNNINNLEIIINKIGGDEKIIKNFDSFEKIYYLKDLDKAQKFISNFIEFINNNDFNLYENEFLTEIININDYINITNEYDFKIPFLSLPKNYLNIFDNLINFSKKYRYYNAYLTSIKYNYPIDSKIIKEIKNEYKNFYNEFINLSPYLCFSELKNCEELNDKLNNWLNNNKIENKILDTINKMKIFYSYNFTFEGNICLKGKMKWDKKYIMNMNLISDGKIKDIIVYIPELEVDNLNLEEENFSFDLIDRPFIFNIFIENKKGTNMGILTCIEKNKNLVNNYNIHKKEEINPFYFEKFNE